ncbi:MAG: lamin tail domain-containing protein [Parcubacteria group bacterium]
MKNKKTNLFFIVILLSAGFFGFSLFSYAAENTLVISELAAGIGSAGNEFVEIYNYGDTGINLKESGLKFKIISSSGTATSKTISWVNEVIPAKGYFLFGAGDVGTEFDATYGGTLLTGNGGAMITDKDGHILDRATWSDLETGESLQRKDGDFEKDNNASFTLNDSPDPQNSEHTEDKDDPEPLPEPEVFSDQIIINELLPAPAANSELSEFVELFNGGDTDEKLDGWYLYDRAKKACDLSGQTIEASGFLVIKNDPNKKCTLALNDTQGELLGLYNPKDVLISSVGYDGSAKKGKSYSFDGEKWHWSQYLTPNKDNLFNNLPIVSATKENKIYVNTYAQFSAKGADKDGENLKFTWDFGDGHKSYLQNTRHKYDKTGDYVATLKVTDSNEDVTTTFKIEVIKFPKLKVSIKEIMPNPKGADTKESGEYILIKNESGKKINLKGWGIATGSKKLVNHPITKDFKLKKGESKKITRKYSKFALTNTKGKIEIRYPNGKTAAKLKYEEEKIADDAIYKKVDKKWAWVTPPSTNKIAVSENPVVTIQPAIENTSTQIQNNLGKYSGNPQWQNKKDNKIILASYASKLSVPKSQSRVLGASIINDSENYFTFTPLVPKEKHWALKFLENIGISINSLLNKFVLLFN